MQKNVLSIYRSEGGIIYPPEAVDMIIFLTVAEGLQTFHLSLAGVGLCSENKRYNYFIMPKSYFKILNIPHRFT